MRPAGQANQDNLIQQKQEAQNQTTGNDKLWLRIVDAIQGEPAYVLVFGVTALFVLSGLSTTVAGVLQKDRFFAVLGVVSFLIALIGTGSVVRIVQKSTPKVIVPTEPGNLGQQLGRATVALKSDELRKMVEKIIEDAAAAIEVGDVVFTEAVLRQFRRFLAGSADWQHRQYVADVDYNEMLSKLYATARSNVFATSDPRYPWQSPIGERLLQAHRNGTAAVIRVFCFNSRSEVTRTTLNEMEKQDRITNISVLAYFEDESLANISPDVERDFTIIDDGDAIGVTESINGQSMIARWYFKDDERKSRFNELRGSIIGNSKKFGEVKADLQTLLDGKN